MAQEKVDDLLETAKYYAQAEKDLDVQHWVFVSIGYQDNTGTRVRLFSYDLPRDVYERRKWVVRWREAHLICAHPKAGITTHLSYYDKRLGNDAKLTSDLRTLISAKAQVTKAQRKLDEYVRYHQENDLFFDPENDTDLIKARNKLAIKIANVQEAEKRLKNKIDQIKNQNDKPTIH